MFLMTQIAVYQQTDGTLGYGYTNDLWNWLRTAKSRNTGITLIAVFPIAWEFKTAFIANVNKALKDKRQANNSYNVSVDELYKLFSTTIQNLKENTYIPSSMIEANKYIPTHEIWNFDYTPDKMFEIRVNT